MPPIQPPKYPANGSAGTKPAFVKEKPVKPRYSEKQMREAVLSGQKRREAKRISNLAPPLRDRRAELQQSADDVAGVFKRSRVSKLTPSNPHKVSHPATRGGDVPPIQKMRQIKADAFLASQLARKREGSEKTTSRYGNGNDIASHQSVSNRCDPPAGGFGRTCGAIVQQSSGNSSSVRQQFFAADFYSLFSELDTNVAENLYHDLSDDQQDQFRDYCLQNVDLGKNEKLMELLFQ